MRELLTGLAIVLIIVLTTILVAPYFVDWNGQRGFLEARLSHALGQRVTIGGNIDLKLLPTPYLVLDQVVVGGDEGPVRVGIHHLALELSATPLMHGEFDITEARLSDPTVRLTLQADHTLPTLPAAPAFAADVRFDRIHVSNGTLVVADPSSGHTFLLDHLDLDADAGSFVGPFKVSGAGGREAARTSFRLSTAAPQDGKAHLRLIIDETAAHAAYDFDGLLDLRGDGEGAIRQSFDGSVKLSGHLASATDVSISWKLSGPLKADSREAALDGGELRLGSDESAVTLNADAKGDFGETPNMSFDLSAKQLDIDRLSGAPIDAAKPPPPKLPGLMTLRRLLVALRPPIRTGLDLYVETATYGGDTLSDLQAHLGLGEATQPLRASADGPGGAHVAIDGRLDMNADPAFTGSVAFAADNLQRTFDWLAGVAPSFPWKGNDLRIRTVRLDGQIKASGDAVEGDRLTLVLDRSILKGKTRVALGDGSQAAKVVADLSADPLDLESLPTFAAWRGSWSGGANPFDLDLRLDAKALKVTRAGDSALETGRIKLALAKTGRRIELKRFDADNLGGATVEATGSLDPQRAKLSLRLDAKRLERFAGLVRQIAPGALADAFVERAPTLAPAKLTIDADLSSPANGTLSPSRLAVGGTLGATKLDVSTKPDPNQAKITSIAATFDAPETGALLDQLGFKTLPLANIGKSRVILSARRRRDDRIDTTLVANLGATKLDATGRFDLASAATIGSGTLRLRSPDLTPLLQSLAIAFPDMSGRVPADLKGNAVLGKDGPGLNDLQGRVAEVGIGGSLAWHDTSGEGPRLTGALDVDRLSLASLVGLALGPEQEPAANAEWSRAPFAGGLIDPPRSAIELKARSFEITRGVTATNARLDIDVSPNLIQLDKLKADLGGGHVEGDVRLRRDGGQATVEGKVGLDHVTIDVPALKTRLSGHMDFAGSGASSLALVSSLAGAGEATADGLAVTGADPKALPHIFDEIENDVLAVDEESVMRAFEEAAAKTTLDAGTRRFGLSLAAGDIHFTPKDAALPEQGPVSSKVEASLGLARFSLDMHVAETLLALPKNWNGPPPTIVVTTQGALGKPIRTYDVSGFLNAVAARALARETARVEAYEFDIRERAFFNARLQSERRREQERLLAEEKARKAEEERKARAEAQRQEKLRKDKDDRDRKAQEDADKAAADGAAQGQPDSRDAAPSPDRSRDAPSSEGPRPSRRPSADERGARPGTAGGPPQPPRRPAPALTDPSTFGRY